MTFRFKQTVINYTNSSNTIIGGGMTYWVLSLAAEMVDGLLITGVEQVY